MGLLSKIISLGIVISSLYPQLKSLRFKKEISRDSEGPLEEPSERALLKEYEVCQQEASDTGSYSWQSGLIFFVTTLALAGAVITGLINAEVSPYRLLLIMGLGGFSITLLLVWKKYLIRQNFIRKVMFHRMKKMERKLGLRKGLYVSFLDETLKNNPLNNKERTELLEEFRGNRGRRPQGLAITMRVVHIAIITWVLLIALELLIFLCHPCREFLFNFNFR